MSDPHDEVNRAQVLILQIDILNKNLLNVRDEALAEKVRLLIADKEAELARLDLG
jgi:hypothetical protein